MFSDIQDLVINGGQFIHKANGPTAPNDDYVDTSPFPKSLVALDAMHDSNQRYPQPKCHPGTRDAVVNTIKDWINDQRATTPPILWLHGTVGVGKSAIMQDICDDLLNPSGPVRASFFFGRGQGKRADGACLLPTIAYQLACNVANCRERMAAVLKSNPHLFKQNASKQALLIIAGINFNSLFLPLSPVVIVVDGLDECNDELVQSDIIALLSDIASESKRPLRFLVATRPETHIRRAFADPVVAKRTKEIALNEPKSAEAIRRYLSSKFDQLVAANPQLFPSGQAWPDPAVLDDLVQGADGQFMFAQIIIRAVSDSRKSPQEQLRVILDDARNMDAFASLDTLYIDILSRIPQPSSLLKILACILSSEKPLGPQVIADFIECPYDTVMTVLLQLRSVLHLQDGSGLQGSIKFAHVSFRDFLRNPARSKAFYPLQGGQCYIIPHFLNRILAHLRSPSEPLLTSLQCKAARTMISDESAGDRLCGCDPDQVCTDLYSATLSFYSIYSVPRPDDNVDDASSGTPLGLPSEARLPFLNLLWLLLRHVDQHDHALLALPSGSRSPVDSVCKCAAQMKTFLNLGHYLPLAYIERKWHQNHPVYRIPEWETLRNQSKGSLTNLARMVDSFASPTVPDSQLIGFSTDARFCTSEVTTELRTPYSIRTWEETPVAALTRSSCDFEKGHWQFDTDPVIDAKGHRLGKPAEEHIEAWTRAGLSRVLRRLRDDDNKRMPAVCGSASSESWSIVSASSEAWSVVSASTSYSSRNAGGASMTPSTWCTSAPNTNGDTNTPATTTTDARDLAPPSPTESLNNPLRPKEFTDADLIELDRLGEGAGGAVHKVQDKRTGLIYARKTITTREVSTRQVTRELAVIATTRHVNIVACEGAYMSPSSSEVKIVMEFCEGGSLEAIGNRIKERGAIVGEKIAGRIAEGVLQGLAYLHSKKTIHRDIKPSNILISRDGIVKLCDFGFSGELIDSMVSTFTGTLYYMAPERIVTGSKGYTVHSDVWSTGIMMLVFVQNRLPFPSGLPALDLMMHITTADPPKLEDEGDITWSGEMKDFISQTLIRGVTLRPTPREMLQHEWIQSVMKQKVDMARWIRQVWQWPRRRDAGKESSMHRRLANIGG